MKIKGWKLMKKIADGEIKEGSKFRDLHQSSKDNFNLYKYENKNLTGRFGGTNLIALLNDDFELIEDEKDIDDIDDIEEVDEYKNEMAYDWFDVQDMSIKINELIKAVKQLNKKLEEK